MKWCLSKIYVNEWFYGKKWALKKSLQRIMNNGHLKIWGHMSDETIFQNIYLKKANIIYVYMCVCVCPYTHTFTHAREWNLTIGTPTGNWLEFPERCRLLTPDPPPMLTTSRACELRFLVQLCNLPRSCCIKYNFIGCRCSIDARPQMSLKYVCGCREELSDALILQRRITHTECWREERWALLFQVPWKFTLLSLCCFLRCDLLWYF